MDEIVLYLVHGAPPLVRTCQLLAYPPSHSEAILELFKMKSCPKMKRNAAICNKIVLFRK